MGQLGMGVMLNMLGGNGDSVEAFKAALNKKITALSMDGDALHFEFEDGYKMRLFDDGQSCCESRYMVCSDDLGAFVGATLLGVEIKEGPSKSEGEWGEEHEVEFLEVKTSLGSFVAETHNEHNGYYGGFYVVCKAE